MDLVNYYNKGDNYSILNYFNGIQEKLKINHTYINTLYEDRIENEKIINDASKSEKQKRWANIIVSSLISNASNDIFEQQLSKILGIVNITTKHGWDGYDKIDNQPYEYKPTKIIKNNYFTATVNINDESYNKIKNISSNKSGFNNYEANFVIAPINKDTSEFICIYKFKEHILIQSRIENLNKPRKKNQRCVYSTNIKKCINLSKQYNEKYYYWHNSKYF